jgi:hypothetical protein
MTALSERRSRLRIETSECKRESGRNREILLEAHPYHAVVRLKGMRSGYEISWASVYDLAVKQAVEAARREKNAKKRT